MLFRRPSASTLDAHQPTTSTCTTATPLFSPRALEVIQKTSALILSAIETEQVAAEQTEAATEQPNTNATDAALAEVA